MDRMKKSPTRRKNAPLIIIAGTILLVCTGIYAIITMVPSPTPLEKSPVNAPPEFAYDDALLSFQKADGEAVSSISVEIVDTDEERTRGMMGRTKLQQHEGMLFIFDSEEVRSFWMVNTAIPLDIIFVGTDRRIVKIHHYAVPYSETSLVSEFPAQFVVEVNAGYCKRNGIQEGDVILWLLK